MFTTTTTNGRGLNELALMGTEPGEAAGHAPGRLALMSVVPPAPRGPRRVPSADPGRRVVPGRHLGLRPRSATVEV